MAACDNLYGNFDQWLELFDFLRENKREYLMYMHRPPMDGQEYRICYIAEIQEFLLENFKAEWAQEKLNDNFDIQTLICGQPHHKRESDEVDNTRDRNKKHKVKSKKSKTN